MRKRYRKNPPLATAALVGGAGIIGFLLYRYVSQPKAPAYVAPAAPAAAAPKSPGFFETILGTGLTYWGQKSAADQEAANRAAFDKQMAAIAAGTSRIAAKATAGALGRIDGGFRDPNLPWGAKPRRASVFSSKGGKGSLG